MAERNICQHDKPAMGELLIRPLVPAPSFSFSILLRDDGDLSVGFPTDQDGFDSLGHGLHALGLTDTFVQLSAAGMKGADRLSSREIDIIFRLVDGDRVPTIARDLFLSQSTIRNHLSSAFRKLGVNSQQQLIDLVKEATQRLRRQDTSST